MPALYAIYNPKGMLVTSVQQKTAQPPSKL